MAGGLVRNGDAESTVASFFAGDVDDAGDSQINGGAGNLNLTKLAEDVYSEKLESVKKEIEELKNTRKELVNKAKEQKEESTAAMKEMLEQ